MEVVKKIPTLSKNGKEVKLKYKIKKLLKSCVTTKIKVVSKAEKIVENMTNTSNTLIGMFLSTHF